MESTGIAGEIQVSQEVYERLKNEFVLEGRGPIDIEGKGQMLTWFLARRKAPTVAAHSMTGASPSNSSTHLTLSTEIPAGDASEGT